MIPPVLTHICAFCLVIFRSLGVWHVWSAEFWHQNNDVDWATFWVFKISALAVDYPLVNVYITMGKITIFNGKIHYIYGHGFKFAFCKRLPGRVNHPAIWIPPFSCESSHWKLWFSIVFCMFTRGYIFMFLSTLPRLVHPPIRWFSWQSCQPILDTPKQGPNMNRWRTLWWFNVANWKIIIFNR